MRVIGLVHFRDERRFLPEYFANVAPQVDGIVALDHGSLDGSAELAAAQPALLELLRVPREAPFHEGRFHRLLIEAALPHGPDWLLEVDADERLERTFRARAVERIARDGGASYAVTVRELWNDAGAYRVDAVWGRKCKVPLFRPLPGHVFDDRPLHASCACLSLSDHPRLDAVVYHLRMLEPADRAERLRKYRRLDPNGRWQPGGYDYFLDETGLELAAVPPDRGYEPRG